MRNPVTLPLPFTPVLILSFRRGVGDPTFRFTFLFQKIPSFDKVFGGDEKMKCLKSNPEGRLELEKREDVTQSWMNPFYPIHMHRSNIYIIFVVHHVTLCTLLEGQEFTHP